MGSGLLLFIFGVQHIWVFPWQLKTIAWILTMVSKYYKNLIAIPAPFPILQEPEKHLIVFFSLILQQLQNKLSL